MKPKVIDLFSGVGGFSQGFKMAGFDIVIANEYDKSIANAYMKNHKDTNMIVGDITEIDLDNIFGNLNNKIDVIIGGPPCQGFSQKGKRKTINDERNYLFKYFVKVVQLVRPQYFVMENVPTLLTSENGLFKREIQSLFNNLGYLLECGILNASEFGVPQNRKRAFIIGKLNDSAPDLPKPNNKRVTIWEAIGDLAFLESGEGEEVQEYRLNPTSKYGKIMRGREKKLYNHVATNHSLLALERLKMIPPNSGKEMLPKEHLTKSVYSGTWTRMRKEDVSVTITTRFDTPSSGKFTHPFLDRAITVREAARIQSFPDSFIFIGNKGSQMKQVGNAVPPLLAAEIAKTIMRDIKKEKRDE